MHECLCLVLQLQACTVLAGGCSSLGCGHKVHVGADWRVACPSPLPQRPIFTAAPAATPSAELAAVQQQQQPPQDGLAGEQVSVIIVGTLMGQSGGDADHAAMLPADDFQCMVQLAAADCSLASNPSQTVHADGCACTGRASRPVSKRERPVNRPHRSSIKRQRPVSKAERPSSPDIAASWPAHAHSVKLTWQSDQGDG